MSVHIMRIGLRELATNWERESTSKIIWVAAKTGCHVQNHKAWKGRLLGRRSQSLSRNGVQLTTEEISLEFKEKPGLEEEFWDSFIDTTVEAQETPKCYKKLYIQRNESLKECICLEMRAQMERTVRVVKKSLGLPQGQGGTEGREHFNKNVVRASQRSLEREELSQQLLTPVTFEKAISGGQWE